MKRAYEEIAADIEKRIQEGRFKPRERLPSVRELCASYRVSQNTAVKAYEVLKSKHLVYSVPQSGCYVLENRRKLEQTERSVIDFARGNPMLGKIHTPDIKHCLDRAIDICNENSAEWHEMYGAPSLRKLLPKYLADFQVFASPENIFVNLGVQQALTLLTHMSFPNQKDTILIEQPTFRYYNWFLKSSGVKVIGIQRDASGIDIATLERLFKNEKIKFFYTVPNSHNPLGTCYSREQRKAIARLAEKYDVYIVEDDYFGDIRFGNHGDALYSYGDQQHHIYLKSFIKIIPWLRIGITVIPTQLLSIFSEQVKQSYFHSYFSPSLVSQATLEIYIRSNVLKKHIAAMKKELAPRLNCLRLRFAEAKQYGAAWIGGESGFYSYLELPENVNEKQFVEILKKRDVIVTPGNECFIENCRQQSGIRLSVARTTAEEIDRGISILYEELRTWKTK
ncbi:PLP-dependent aminotransferase family protein [Azotosporobacter soli]|uniref:aminotransferase-like domain-containing protein n=1 Tax=Azotosporobacter soli TaxID=3055040 RepID=UPI0031FEF3EC